MWCTCCKSSGLLPHEYQQQQQQKPLLKTSRPIKDSPVYRVIEEKRTKNTERNLYVFRYGEFGTLEIVTDEDGDKFAAEPSAANLADSTPQTDPEPPLPPSSTTGFSFVGPIPLHWGLFSLCHVLAVLLRQCVFQLQQIPKCANGFKPGMGLEGLDPRHPSMFCVLSVTDVVGFRIRVGFEGFKPCYDFWVDANSPDIFPPGWCDRNRHVLHPPKGELPILSHIPH
ncbi:L3MBTL4 [Cordylochernes scorpioides]|uniref:L3MBTL4 n=1 Tax=Cordylochernes scorpioides TaxID=51811 RepID=A0ABY6K0N8_9ARAC|nr:L3MBTL4 [Cordylochernes scorpioides]